MRYSRVDVRVGIPGSPSRAAPMLISAKREMHVKRGRDSGREPYQATKRRLCLTCYAGTSGGTTLVKATGRFRKIDQITVSRVPDDHCSDR
jgi:hypothetical protein